MSYLNAVLQNNVALCPAGTLSVVNQGVTTNVSVHAFDLMKRGVVVGEWKNFLESQEDRPHWRFAQGPDGYVNPTHKAASHEALEKVEPAEVIVPNQPVSPIPFSLIIKLPTVGEWEERFKSYEAGLRKLLLNDEYAATEVDYFEAAAFAAAVGWRLPTQVERHYAALAGRQGDDICGVSGDGKLLINNAQWLPDEKKGPAKPGSFAPTPWGHHDLAGNNWEWVALQDILQGFSGGAWGSKDPRHLRAASFLRRYAHTRFDNLGFRLARSHPQHSHKGAIV